MAVLMTMCESMVCAADELLTNRDSALTVSLAFERIKPDLFAPGHLIEVQVAFHAVRVSRAEYVFLPKLRALCLLDRTAEKVRCDSLREVGMVCSRWLSGIQRCSYQGDELQARVATEEGQEEGGI